MKYFWGWCVAAALCLSSASASAGDTWCEREVARLTALIAANEAHEAGLQAYIESINQMLENATLSREQRLMLLEMLVQAHQDLQATLLYSIELLHRKIAVLNICAVSPGLNPEVPMVPVPDPMFL